MKKKNPILILAEGVNAARAPAVNVPRCTFREFLQDYARVRSRDGSYGPFSFMGRQPLVEISILIDKIVRNTVHRETVEIDGVTFRGHVDSAGQWQGDLKGATVSVCGGAQFGKTVLELNLIAHATSIEFLNAGYYTSDQQLLATIVDTKFRPDVIDQVPWMSSMVQLNKSQSKSGKSVDRKNAFQVTDGARKAFGYFSGMQKPPTTISLDIAILDEVDDIPERNIGFIAGRMTNSSVQLTCFIGTQRVHAAGQNARWQSGTMHKWSVMCARCGRFHNLEEHWPGICKVSATGEQKPDDPRLSETMTFDPSALYYPACPDCGEPLDPDKGHYAPEHPERVRAKNWSFRAAQFDVPAIPWRDIVASWFSALADPSPDAMVAWHCDRRAIPHAGAAQPITPAVLSRARSSGTADTPSDETAEKPYPMTLASVAAGRPYPGIKCAGLDTGPRCWLTVNEVVSPFVSALSWAEMIPSGNTFARCLQLVEANLISCLFIDAGGEPDLTKRLCLALNGLDNYAPPPGAATDLRGMNLQPHPGLSWDGRNARWRGIRAAAVSFSMTAAGGVVQDIGITQDGKIYPLIKCNRGESIEGLVNDLLTPSEGVVQHVVDGGKPAVLRSLPRQRLPETCLGAGVTESMLDTHLLNLRKIRDAKTQKEDWADHVENHLGLSLVYARLSAIVATAAGPAPCGASTRWAPDPDAGDARADRRGMTVPLRSRRFIA